MTATWPTLPEAAAILSGFATNPPASRIKPYKFGDTARLYIGKEVRALRAIWRNERRRLLKLGDEMGDHSAFKAHCALTVEDAIDDVLIRANLERSAECDRRSIMSRAA